MSNKSSTKKKVDGRIKILIDNSIKERTRTMMMIVGDKAKEQVMNLHHMLSKAQVKSRPNILWCYKKDLGFQSDDRSRFKKLKKKAKKFDEEVDKKEDVMNDPFHMFVSSTDIRFCYFKESQNVLGQTFGMLVLQDFEGITPNILARTIETVEGGGMIVFLLPDMDSLKSIYSMTMDVHSRYRTSALHDIVPRFNERFLLSLAVCKNCLVVDDQLEILPLSSHISKIESVKLDDDRQGDHIISENERELGKMKLNLKDTQPVGGLLSLTKTYDQGKSLLQFVEAISEKTLQTTVALTAARGRGKSAALGLAISSAVAYGYSNIFVTSPTPENLKTLFDFILKGFDVLGYKDQMDYEIVQSTNPLFKKAIVRINIYRDHRQTIQYINPTDYQKLGQAELVVIDEAAAIPLPVVKNLVGPYLIFMSSTINGYEGTGRSLSLKLIKEMREKAGRGGDKGRKFFESKLEEPIRYGLGDPIESWLNGLLCLDATNAALLNTKCPYPQDCNLYYVNRDTLFSFNEASETFLHNMMSLYVSSHYKNSPNDLQMMSDAPGHHLFVLLGPVNEKSNSLPDVLCVIQVALEGKISEKTMMSNLSKGLNPDGDLIPYLIARQYQDNDFGTLSGARIVRIATHPEYHKMGYGSRAMDLLSQYYSGQLYDADEAQEVFAKENVKSTEGLSKEVIQPRDRTKLPPLLTALTDRKPEDLQYLGVSYGLTKDLLNFWKKNQFDPVYIRMTENDLTGEHTCVVLKGFESVSQKLIGNFFTDFSKRFLSLLAYDFRKFEAPLVANVLNFQQEKDSDVTGRVTSLQEMDLLFTSFDIKRLTSYSQNLVDWHVIMDLIESIAKLFFLRKLPFALSFTQAELLIEMGLQHKDVDHLTLGLPVNQILALFNKIIRKVVKYFVEVEKTRKIESRAPKEKKVEKKVAPVVEEAEHPLNSIFDKPLKRKTDGDEASNKKMKKDIDEIKNLTKEVMGDRRYNMTGVQDVVAVDVSRGLVQLKEESKHKVKKHHFKDEEEMQKEKDAEKAKMFKKGGKTKRKTKL